MSIKLKASIWLNVVLCAVILGYVSFQVYCSAQRKIATSISPDRKWRCVVINEEASPFQCTAVFNIESVDGLPLSGTRTVCYSDSIGLGCGSFKWTANTVTIETNKGGFSAEFGNGEQHWK